MKDRCCSAFVTGLWVVGVILMLASEALAQLDGSLSSHSLRVDVNLVTFNFSATDKQHRNISNLEKNDVVVYEDDVSQQITYFDSEPMPLSLAVLVDVSESTEPYSRQIRFASRVLADLLSEQDDAAVIAFSNLPNLLQELTCDKERIRSALYKAGSSFGGATNINDSIYLAARRLKSAPLDKRRVVLLISDGNGNRGEQERAFTQLKACGATLLGIGIGATSKLYRRSLLLSRWIKETGGNFLLYSPDIEMRRNLAQELDSVRRRYSAAYTPSNKQRDGKFRRLRFEISQESPFASKKVSIQGPEGYFAPSEACLYP